MKLEASALDRGAEDAFTCASRLRALEAAGDAERAGALLPECIDRAAAALDAARKASLSLLRGRDAEARDSLLPDARRLYTIARRLDSLLGGHCEKLLRARGAAAARDEFAALADRWPDETAFPLHRAFALELIPDSAGALAAYGRILREHPTEKRAHLALGRLQEAKGALREALLSYKRAFAVDRSDSAACSAVVRLSEGTGSTPELIEDWLAMARAQPGDTMLLRRLLPLLERAGRETDAARIRAQIPESPASIPSESE